jgi:hypothetical protein
LQSERLSRALQVLPSDARDRAIEFFLAMIDPVERDKVAGLVWRDDGARRGVVP